MLYAAAAADSEGGGGDSQQAAAAAERRLPAAKRRLDRTTAEQRRSSIRNAAKRGAVRNPGRGKRGAVRNPGHLEFAGADEGEADAAADEGEAGETAAAEGQDAGAADEGSGKDHARRGSGGRGGEGLGKRSRQTTNLQYTMLAETGKMSWADACYYSLFYSNLDFDKKFWPVQLMHLPQFRTPQRRSRTPLKAEAAATAAAAAAVAATPPRRACRPTHHPSTLQSTLPTAWQSQLMWKATDNVSNLV